MRLQRHTKLGSHSYKRKAKPTRNPHVFARRPKVQTQPVRPMARQTVRRRHPRPHEVPQHQSVPVTPKDAAKKPLIIAGISIGAVILLSLLLFFTTQFVGKAIDVGSLNDKGGGVTNPTQLYFPGEDGSVELWVHLGNDDPALESAFGRLTLVYGPGLVAPTAENVASKLVFEDELNLQVITSSVEEVADDAGNVEQTKAIYTFAVVPPANFVGDATELRLSGKVKLGRVLFTVDPGVSVPSDVAHATATLEVENLEMLDSNPNVDASALDILGGFDEVGAEIWITKACEQNQGCSDRHHIYPYCKVNDDGPNRCVACTTDEHCAGRQTCSNNACVPGDPIPCEVIGQTECTVDGNALTCKNNGDGNSLCVTADCDKGLDDFVAEITVPEGNPLSCPQGYEFVGQYCLTTGSSQRLGEGLIDECLGIGSYCGLKGTFLEEQCLADEGGCSSSDQCEGDLVCITQESDYHEDVKTCGTCRNNDDCEDDESCSAGVCGTCSLQGLEFCDETACTNLDNAEWSNNACIESGCTQDSQCAAGEHCVNRECGTCGLDDLDFCTTQGECDGLEGTEWDEACVLAVPRINMQYANSIARGEGTDLKVGFTVANIVLADDATGNHVDLTITETAEALHLGANGLSEENGVLTYTYSNVVEDTYTIRAELKDGTEQTIAGRAADVSSTIEKTVGGNDPSITITSPANGATSLDSDITIGFSLQNFVLAGVNDVQPNHLHVVVDDAAPIEVYSDTNGLTVPEQGDAYSYRLTGLTNEDHMITIDLRGIDSSSNHNAVVVGDNIVQDSVTFNVGTACTSDLECPIVNELCQAGVCSAVIGCTDSDANNLGNAGEVISLHGGAAYRYEDHCVAQAGAIQAADSGSHLIEYTCQTAVSLRTEHECTCTQGACGDAPDPGEDTGDTGEDTGDTGETGEEPEEIPVVVPTLRSSKEGDDTYVTTITTAESFAGKEITIYTVLRDADGNPLVIKTERVQGIDVGGSIESKVNYPFAVGKKDVLVFDKLPDQGMSVNARLE